MTTGRKLNRVRRAAAEWLARKQAGFGPGEAEGFAAWRDADARHRVTFDEMESAWAEFDCLSFYPGAAEGAPDPDFVAPQGKRSGRHRSWVVALAAAASLAVAFLVWRSRPHGPNVAAALHSEVAASREVEFLHLPDGSEVELHPGSVVREEFTTGERRIRLVRGEAEFSVAHNKARPFIVDAAGVPTRAVGTEFDVRLGATAVDVLVSEGIVQVGNPDMQRTVIARQRATFPIGSARETTPPAVTTVADADMDRALAWQKDRLVFDATPLSEVAARVNLWAANRRDPMHLVLGDTEVGSIRVTGRVPSRAFGDFVTVLQSDFGVDVERRQGGEIVLTCRAR